MLLLAEPDIIQATALAGYLRDWGYDFRTAEDPAGILALCERHTFLLALLVDRYDRAEDGEHMAAVLIRSFNLPALLLPKPYTLAQCRRAIEQSMGFLPV